MSRMLPTAELQRFLEAHPIDPLLLDLYASEGAWNAIF